MDHKIEVENGRVCVTTGDLLHGGLQTAFRDKGKAAEMIALLHERILELQEERNQIRALREQHAQDACAWSDETERLRKETEEAREASHMLYGCVSSMWPASLRELWMVEARKRWPWLEKPVCPLTD